MTSLLQTQIFALSPWQKWRLKICMESAAEVNDITKICCTLYVIVLVLDVFSHNLLLTSWHWQGMWTCPLLRQHSQDIQNKPITLQEACFKGLDVSHVNSPKIRCSKSFPRCHPWGDLKTLEDSLTAAGANIDEKDAKGISCLGYAIGANRTHVVKKLLESKAGWDLWWGSGWVGVGVGIGIGVGIGVWWVEWSDFMGDRAEGPKDPRLHRPGAGSESDDVWSLAWRPHRNAQLVCGFHPDPPLTTSGNLTELWYWPVRKGFNCQREYFFGPVMDDLPSLVNLPKVTLWWTNIAMENHHFLWENPL